MIDKATVEKIKDAADIVEVVSDYVHLQRRGANYVGLCPFHNERTPSFSVNRGKNFCYCFSCHKGGSPVNFIMEKEGVSYHDALLHLARKYNIKVEERELSDEERRTQSEREAMFVANEWAASEMARTLHETDDGKDIGLSYLYGRGITAEAVAKFRLGYSLDHGSDMAVKARKSGFDTELMCKLGILGKSQEGRIYDRFRGRVIFPIMNASGKVVGFGGRDLKGGPAKYINSPESSVYKKSNELYGMFQAKSEMVRQDKCYLVEGYLDVIGMWQAGLQNVVASSGTALTDGQIALIHRFTNKITLIYDGDAAGIKASLRGIDMLLRHRMEVKVLLLPDGHDPHSFANERTPEQFREYIKSHETDIIRFQTQVLLDEAGQDPQRRITAANSVVQSIASIPDPLSRAVYIQECATVFGLPENSIAAATEATRKALELRYQHEKEQEHRRLRNDQAGNISGDAGRPSTEAIDRQEPVAGAEVRQTAPAGTVEDIPATGGNRSNLERESGRSHVRRRKERVLVELCIKYGLVPFCDIEFENGEKGMMNVAEFVKDELECDDIALSTPLYSRVLDTVIGMRGEMERSLAGYMCNIEEKLAEFRRAETERIGTSAISMQGIEIAEKKLQQEIESRRGRASIAYMKEYPARMLASHEDDEIRRLATEILSSPRRLSNIYIKDVRPEELEKEEQARMGSAVDRGILELKSEVLEEEYLDKMSRLREAVAGNAPAEDVRELQSQLRNIMQLRSNLAKDLGDRAVSPSNR